MHEELDIEGTPGRSTWRRRFRMPIRSVLGLEIEFGWRIWSLGMRERERAREGVRERELTGRESEREKKAPGKYKAAFQRGRMIRLSFGTSGVLHVTL
jgi:hypothetical protein